MTLLRERGDFLVLFLSRRFLIDVSSSRITLQDLRYPRKCLPNIMRHL